MAELYSHTFVTTTALPSLPSEVDVGSFAGYTSATVTSIVVRFKKSFVAGSNLCGAAVRVDGEGLSDYATQTVAFDSLEEKTITLTFSTPPVARLDEFNRISVYAKADFISGGVCNWCSDGLVYLQVYGTLNGLQKPTTPTPADASGPGIAFSDFTLSWVDGGGAETYNVYIGETGSLTLVSSGQAGTSYVTDMDELETIFDSSPINQVVYWRVDAVAGEYTATGDEWSFDPRPAVVTNPTPANAATGQRMFPTYSWDAAAEAVTYTLDVTVGGSAHLSVPLISDTEYESAVVNFEQGMVYGYNAEYAWRVDSVNTFGTTTGTAWSFNSVVFDPPIPSWENIPGKTLGPLDDPPGTKGTDYRWLGLNNMNTVKYLLVAKDMSVYWAEVY